MAMRGMKIIDVFTRATSPWIEKDGESYILDLEFFSKKLCELNKGDSYYGIDKVIRVHIENGTIKSFNFMNGNGNQPRSASPVRHMPDQWW